jgi:hypothetical protein
MHPSHSKTTCPTPPRECLSPPFTHLRQLWRGFSFMPPPRFVHDWPRSTMGGITVGPRLNTISYKFFSVSMNFHFFCHGLILSYDDHFRSTTILSFLPLHWHTYFYIHPISRFINYNRQHQHWIYIWDPTDCSRGSRDTGGDDWQDVQTERSRLARFARLTTDKILRVCSFLS